MGSHFSPKNKGGKSSARQWARIFLRKTKEDSMNQNNEPIRDASVLGIPKMLLLGLQHMFAMFGATILVPILVNSYFGEDVRARQKVETESQKSR